MSTGTKRLNKHLNKILSVAFLRFFRWGSKSLSLHRFPLSMKLELYPLSIINSSTLQSGNSGFDLPRNFLKEE
jgi:hypothetical protein